MYRILSWDSDFFGYKVGQIDQPPIDAKTFDATIEAARRNSVKVLYLSVAPENSFANVFALARGGMLVDEKVTFRKSLDERTVRSDIGNKEVHVYTEKELSPGMESIAIQCGEYSRFNVDKRFGRENYERLYKLWLRKAVSGECADAVFVYRSGGHACGLIAVSTKDEIGRIGLLGIDVASRNSGIGTALLTAGIEKAYRDGCTAIRVTTQHRNSAACKFYNKNGFSVEEIRSVYHLWV